MRCPRRGHIATRRATPATRAGMSLFYGAADVESTSSSSDDDGARDDGARDDATTTAKDAHRVARRPTTVTTLPRAADVMTALDGDDDEATLKTVTRGTTARGMARAVADALRETRRDAYYAETAREDGAKDAATIRVDARRVMIVEQRVAVRLMTKTSNGVLEAVAATGARATTTDASAEEDFDEREKRRIAITGPPESVQKCVELIESLVRETENRTSKRFFCPKAYLGAFIGRGYGHVHKIEGVSKCKIVISDEDKVHEGNEHSVVRAIEVTGTPMQVSLGYKLALQTLDEALASAPDAEELKAELKETSGGFDLDAERAKKKAKN